jgi:site-specific DNA-methyltransferase (adenine-specific)
VKHEVIRGDAPEVIRGLGEASFDACLCDPPYHLTSKDGTKGFMDQKWDGGDVAFRKDTWDAVRRALKPGAFLMAFGGTRTFHRLVCAIEDAGMDVRDLVVWMYADGRPPNLDISKAIDKARGAERKVVGKYQPPGMSKPWNLSKAKDERTVNTFASSRNNLDITEPATEEARTWAGYGTVLKPSCELVSVSMRPMEAGFVENALSVGVAGLNIDAARIPVLGGEELKGGSGGRLSHFRDGKPYGDDNGYVPSPLGRWPKNVVFDEDAACMLARSFPGVERFFYCGKVTTGERNAGLPKGMVNDHPTLKPIFLTRYLASLLLPPKRASSPRRILVPFSGAGSEMIGAVLAGWDEVVGIENGGGDPEAATRIVAIANARLRHWSGKLVEESGGLFE